MVTRAQFIVNLPLPLLFAPQVVFNVSVELPGCVSEPLHFSLKPVGLRDSLEVELSSLCSCDCPPRPPGANGSRCAEGQGAFQCGVCVCRPGFLGAECECNEESALSSNCVANNETETCSGQGDCFCGQCACHPSSFGRVYGPHCECDDYSCVRFRGELCGGGPLRVMNCARVAWRRALIH